MAVNYDIIIEQGATKSFTIIYKNELQEAIDLTGYTARGQIRMKPSDVTPLATFDVNIANPTGGVISVILPATALVGNPLISGKTSSQYTNAIYDIELVNGSVVTRLLQGKCSISPEVTK